MSLTKVSYSMINGEVLNVLDFGADSTGSVDSTAAFQAALDAANGVTNPPGKAVFVPAGTYKISSALNIYAYTTLFGCGRKNTTLSFTHTGDGIKSTWPINGSHGVNITVKDIGLVCTNTSNTGNGFVDQTGSYITLDNVYTNGFMYGITFDQTEISLINNCEIVRNSYSKAGIWLVNGADRVVGVQTNFTNNIKITNNQIYGTGTCAGIVDDGGISHTYIGNSIDSGDIGMRLCSVYGLIVDGNEIELNTSFGIYVTDVTANIGPLAIGAQTLNPCKAVRIHSNFFYSNSVGPYYTISVISASNINISNNNATTFTNVNIDPNQGWNSLFNDIAIGTTGASQSGFVTDPVGISLFRNGTGIFTRNSANAVLFLNAKPTGSTVLANFASGGANVGSITSNGSNTTYNTVSDYRLKKNISPMTGALDKIQKLNPVTYTWKNTGIESQGFIAHELQEIVPDCVTGEKDAVDENGEPKYQGIDTSFLVATLVKAIQELKAEVDALKGSK